MVDESKNLGEPDETTDMAPPAKVEELLSEETPTPKEEKENTYTMIEETKPSIVFPAGIRLPTFRERLSATLFDLIFLAYLYFATVGIYHYIAWGEFIRPITFRGGHGLLLHGIFGALAFLYFFLGEGVFYTTLGKFFGRLSVKNKRQMPPSLIAVTLRNLLRPVDYFLALFPWFSWVLLEKTPRQQRLGDLLAGTHIIKNEMSQNRTPIDRGNIASSSLRLFSETLDLCLGLAWVGGVLLLIDYQRPNLSLLILLVTPLLYWVWNILWVTLFETTFGLWVFGCKLVQENGWPIGFANAFLRGLFQKFSLVPPSLLFLFMSPHKQTGPDIIGGTVAIHYRRSWNAMIGVGASFALIGVVWFAGLANPHSYLTPFFKSDFLQKGMHIKIGGVKKQTDEKRLFIKRLTFFAADRTTPIAEPIFKSGDTIYYTFDLTGFTIRDNEAWLQEDLTVRYPDHSIGFKQETIVDFHQKLTDPEQPLEITNTLSLPSDASPGVYTLVLVLHDRLSDRHLTEQRTMRVVP